MTGVQTCALPISGKLNVRGEQVYALRMVENPASGREWLVHDDPAQDSRKRGLHLVGLLVAQARSHGTLRINVHKQDAPALTGKADPDTDRAYRFGTAPFLVT